MKSTPLFGCTAWHSARPLPSSRGCNTKGRARNEKKNGVRKRRNHTI